MNKIQQKAQYLYWVKLRPMIIVIKHSIAKVLIKAFHFHCWSCFRFEAREDETGGWWKIAKRPRPGQSVYCWNHDARIEWDGNEMACEHWEARWWWNLKQYRDYAKYNAGRRWYEHVRKRVGGLRKPVPLRWVDYFDGMRDEIVSAGEPQCPHCGEMPYSTKQCQFCGQRFTNASN